MTATIERPRRYDQCDNTCTVDCGHCKGAGPPRAISVRTREARAALNALHLAGDAVEFIEWATRWHPAVVLAWADAFVLEQSK